MNLSLIFKAALEDIADGKVHLEREHVFYGKIVDFEQLKKATSEQAQEQWEIKLPKSDKNFGSGGIRVRACGPKEQNEYILTCKVRTTEANAKLESSVVTTKDMFDLFKTLAHSGMRKVRHNFPVTVDETELIFEVDVFVLDDGTYSPWCKIDLEVPDSVTKIPPLPIELAHMVKEGPENTDAERAIVRGLYDNVFLTTCRTLNS
jgi:CYTH domain-containing protein